ncbi:hypothetical protein [Hymenobacter psoromatis]|uniref:hypothetical protein n=1 Tax=Hymenobacter psoromatis TaxID=1484116 RepID=UPI001CBEA670|nr:hypothetical protein [Hymenobacter psoromatis]
MQPIVIAAFPLTYAEYRKLSFAEYRARHPAIYVSLPIILLITLIFLALIVVDAGFAAVDWQSARPLLLISGAILLIWIATWYSLRRNYSQSNTIKDGIAYRLDEQGIAPDGDRELTLWSNIEKTATSSGQWILLRQANYHSKEIYFLNSTSVVPPATRADFHALLKYKRIKPL